MKKLLLATTAALGLMVSAGAANATLTYTIWSGTGLEHGANFPVPTTDLLASFTSTTPIDFRNTNPDGGSNTLGDFFNGAPGPNPVPLVSTPALTAAQLATVMSTPDTGSDLSTVIRITETYDLTAPFLGSIDHDDGAQIVIDGNSSTGAGSTFICGLPGPGLGKHPSLRLQPIGRSHPHAFVYRGQWVASHPRGKHPARNCHPRTRQHGAPWHRPGRFRPGSAAAPQQRISNAGIERVA